MAVSDAHVFPEFLTPVLTQLFFPKPPTTLLTRFCKGERRKYAGKKVLLNRGSNSQAPGHESDTLTIEPPGRGVTVGKEDRSRCCMKRSRNNGKRKDRRNIKERRKGIWGRGPGTKAEEAGPIFTNRSYKHSSYYSPRF